MEFMGFEAQDASLRVSKSCYKDWENDFLETVIVYTNQSFPTELKGVAVISSARFHFNTTV